jgi:hypothetical protein
VPALLVRWSHLAVAVACAAAVVPGIGVHGGLAAVLWIAGVLGLVRVVASLAVSLLGGGIVGWPPLVAPVVDALVLGGVAAALDRFDVAGVESAVAGALVVNLVVGVLELATWAGRPAPSRPSVLVASAGVLAVLVGGFSLLHLLAGLAGDPSARELADAVYAVDLPAWGAMAAVLGSPACARPADR